MDKLRIADDDFSVFDRLVEAKRGWLRSNTGSQENYMSEGMQFNELMSHFDLDEPAPKNVELGSTVNVRRQSPGKRRLSYYPGHRTTGKVQMKLGGRNAAAATGVLNSPARKDQLVNNDYTAA